MVLCPGMLSLRWHALVLSLLVILADRAQAARLVVTIDGLRSGTGDVYVALYSRPDQFPDGDYSDQHQNRHYALGAYHDENANGKLDTNLIGLSD